MTHDEMMNLINRSLFATIGYTDEQGRQNVRRVFCVWHKGLGRHLISTNTSSRHVQTLMNKPDMCLYFSDDSSFEGLCLYGKAVIHMEREYKELLWNEGDEKYYPKGIDDEDYCILEFVADSGRFYRYDGKGDISKEEIEQYDVNKVFENGYSKVSVKAEKKTGNRVIVLGCSGSGKSTFSRALQEKTGLPLFYLDNIWWNPDRTHITRDEFDEKLAEIMEGEKWIIDGDYSRTYEPRFIHCDTIIFLDYSFEECMKGIRDRVGTVREDIPWTEQELDPELVEMVQNYRRDKRPKVYDLIEKYQDKKVFIFKTRAEAEQFLAEYCAL